MAAVANIEVVAKEVDKREEEASLPEADIASARAIVASECSRRRGGGVCVCVWGGGE